MGKYLNDPRKPLLRIKIGKRNFKGLANLAGTVVLKMTGNVFFTTPVPPLATITTDVTALRTLMALSDFKRNRGSKADINNTIAAAATLRSDLIALFNYVVNTAQTTSTDVYEQAAILASSGFAQRKIRAKVASQQIPRFVQQNNSKKYPPNGLRLKWAKPLGNVKGQPIAGYNIKVGGVIVATTTATFHVFAPLLAPGIIAGYIVPFNDRGEGRPMFFTLRG